MVEKDNTKTDIVTGWAKVLYNQSCLFPITRTTLSETCKRILLSIIPLRKITKNREVVGYPGIGSVTIYVPNENSWNRRKYDK